jgi:1-hydroxycarotenoid 3,4-desaturase
VQSDRVVVIGAGIGGLVAALLLAARGLAVTVVERASAPGGKMREVVVGGAPIDAGPTVFTMRWVLDEILAEAGARPDDHLALHRAETLARHAWDDGSRLDLFADIDRSAAPPACGGRAASGERIPADAVVCAADVAALAAGLFGAPASRAVERGDDAVRSLSAVTWALTGRAAGVPLPRHAVFFAPDCQAEFDAIFARGRLPDQPTVYVCAQDRGDAATAPDGPERLLILVNAPPTGDRAPPSPQEIASCEQATFARLARAGLTLEPAAEPVVTTPAEFARMFPATGGALYGRAVHGWRASFRRPNAATRLAGLVLAGGSVHPGPGVPMAAMSGRLAAAAVLADLASTRTSRRAAMPGGMSMR